MTLKKNKSKKKSLRQTKRKKIILLGIAIILGFLVYSLLKDIPNPKKLSSGEYSESSQIMDRNGKMLYEIYVDKNRTSVGLAQIPDKVIKATLAIEDSNFYKHAGFDIRGIVRGLFRTVFQGRLQGGSTLTQQLVKNALLTPERTWERKIKEAILTVATEALYSKDQILEMYFNQTPYGGTMWGVESAAKGIFSKDVKDLSLGEAALIAGLPGSPTRYSPFAHPDAAKNRQEMVLKRMEELKYISPEEYENAKNEKLDYNLNRNSILAPHFVFYVREKLIEKYGIQKVTEGGLKVWTSLDLDIQNYAQEQVADEIEKLKKQRVSNGAALITDSKSGQILAMVGSKDYFDTEIDGKYNVTTALRQPGSSIKPLNYAVGIETGKATAASIFDDNPTCFKVENQKQYCPTNYGGAYHGVQTLRNSLGNSLNIPAVKMLSLNTVQTFVASASAMGISTFKNSSDYGLSLTLGGGEVYMTDMATAFGVFSNMGIKQDLVSILKVTDKTGQVLEEYKYVPGERVLSSETAYIIANILSDDGARSMVFGRGSMLNIKKHPEVAVKTGTTNDLRDNWTIGFTPEVVVAVWVGNNDNSRMGGVTSGTTGASPIWNRIMTKVLENRAVKTFTKPDGILTMSVCNLTGQLAPEEGCESHNELFKKEYVPTLRISLQNNILIDKTTNKIVAEGEDNPNAEWQNKQSVVDITGKWVCLDCPKDESNN
ncbi:MAG: Penicillin-binding protein, 1A family [Candidatus Shapirobacteria bacterium GW2011_GWE1_38_10]|uniref:Penicillin-binding protein, 1A family n=1 Tax=Candidatus Shapirobacteria bacterium GW2011_GWE1_38_10 TaxID=1618488 RepID=A0A0G0I834_9BACT|nr:MAG: Penicillin-binding protein, 1A family [Candidatus Shapirobacteria bacterium GW2011_GWF2_37_20]KKQ50677.1 MAG: Penicillin-binding protein, 1A family [Candidatus Shapirobacteria bacterium GW2011_GWE1_38_10]KKQ64388.1 MAG: Penicillin-binding protein, 1A family [Candidatus Shapirobacteria bacterium GW2011_GWF1_38_23]